MGTLARRLERLEQQAGGQQGEGVCGMRAVHWERHTGPDVVRVFGTEERLTEADFLRRYPKGILIYRLCFTDEDPTDLEGV